MIQTGLIPSAHDDLISDADFDYYGTRLATCGLDQKIKIWRDPFAYPSQLPTQSNTDESNKSWTLEDEFKAHDAPILSLSWAHPEFGRMLVSGSMDRTVKVWEWVPAFLGPTGGRGPVNGSSGGLEQGGTGTRWRSHTILTDAKGSVRSVEFAPPVFGLKLASLATDNLLRVYDCLDSEHFTNVDTVDILSLASPPSQLQPSSSSLNLNTTKSSNGTSGGVSVPIPSSFEDAHDLHSFLSNLNNTTTSDTQASLKSRGRANGGDTSGSVTKNAQGVVVKEADGGWTISWCKDAYWGQVLAVGCGIEGVVKIVQVCTLEQQSYALLTLDPYAHPSSFIPPAKSVSSARPPASSSAPTPTVPNLTTPTTTQPERKEKVGPKRFAVTSVAWAPTCGRSFHTIAMGSRDGRVRVWKVKAPSPNLPNNGVSNTGGMDVDIGGGKGKEERWSASLVADFGEHEYAVSKVDWNITGTILTSSGADGHVKLYKMSLGGVWRPVGGVSGQQGDLSGLGHSGSGKERGGRKEVRGRGEDVRMGD